jgi:hypothetical protein
LGKKLKGEKVLLEKKEFCKEMFVLNVRYCQIKTTTCVEKKHLLRSRPQNCHSWVQSEAAWLNWVVGFIGGAKPWWRERVSGL